MTIHAAAPPVPDGRMATLDDLDRQIVATLRANGRISMRALASELHISRANAYARVDRLERDGVITGYSAIINPQKYGYGLSAYVFLKIAQQSWKKVRNQVLSIPEVDHAALVSGEHDIMLLRADPRCRLLARPGTDPAAGHAGGRRHPDGPDLR